AGYVNSIVKPKCQFYSVRILNERICQVQLMKAVYQMLASMINSMWLAIAARQVLKHWAGINRCFAPFPKRLKPFPLQTHGTPYCTFSEPWREQSRDRT